MRNWLVAIAIVAAGLCACSGTTLPDRSVPAGNSPAAQRANVGQGRGRLRLVLPPIAFYKAPIPWVSRPQWLSSATQAAEFSINGKVYGSIFLDPSTPACITGSAGLTCTFSARVPAGTNQKITVRTYQDVTEAGPPLAEGTIVKNIYARQTTTYAVPMYGIAKQIGLRTQDPVLTLGQATAEPIIVVGIDASRRVIPSTNVVGAEDLGLPPVTVTYSGFVSGTLSTNYGQQTSFPCCGILAPTFEYDGEQTGSETFKVSASGYHPKPINIHVVTGSTALATIVASTGNLDGPNLIVQFPSDANGDVAPTRVFSPRTFVEYYSVYGEDGQGNFWSGQTHYSNSGRILGTINLPNTELPLARDAAGDIYTVVRNAPACSVFEYGGTYGVAIPLREVDYTCTASEAMGVDAAGDIYVSQDSYSQAPVTIAEFAAGTGSGTVTPTRVIPMPTTSPANYYQTMGIDADAADNLYVAFSSFAVGPGWTTNVYKVLPGSTTPSIILPNAPVESMAVDDAGDIYARTYIENTLNALQVFPVGSTTPAQTISGPKTRLYYEGSITVPRAWTVSSQRRRLHTRLH